MNKARITYRFEHNRSNDGNSGSSKPVKENKVIPLYEEEYEVVEESHTASEPLNTFTSDFGNWNSPFETENERVERGIRETVYEAARVPKGPYGGKEHQESVHDPELWSTWTNAQPNNRSDGRARVVKSSGTSWFRIATSIAAAVITGIAFGFFVLSMFTNHDLPAEQLPDSSQAKQITPLTGEGSKDSAPVQGTAESGKTNQEATGAVGTVHTVSLTLAAKSYSFLQNGVFSSLQSAQSAQSELKKKGFASALELGDKTTVYVAFAESRDEALSLSQRPKDQKLEVYIKTVDFPAVASISWNGDKPDALGAFIDQGDKLIRMLSGLTVVHLAETSPTPLDDSTLSGIRSAHQAMTTISISLNEGVDKELRPSAEQMSTALNSAVQSMEEYKKNPSASMLWQAQSSMMQYILTQKELLAKIRIS